jgi:hypothetical protein
MLLLLLLLLLLLSLKRCALVHPAHPVHLLLGMHVVLGSGGAQSAEATQAQAGATTGADEPLVAAVGSQAAAAAAPKNPKKRRGRNRDVDPAAMDQGAATAAADARIEGWAREAADAAAAAAAASAPSAAAGDLTPAPVSATVTRRRLNRCWGGAAGHGVHWRLSGGGDCRGC